MHTGVYFMSECDLNMKVRWAVNAHRSRGKIKCFSINFKAF